MRDYRDAKAMAHLLREELAAKHLKITVSESLELIARLFGMGDWNTLSALIKQSDPSQSTGARAGSVVVQFSRTTEEALARSLTAAADRGQAFATVEHLLLALTYDPDVSAIMQACAVDPTAIRESLYRSAEVGPFRKNDVGALAPTPSPDFQRVVSRAIRNKQGSSGGGLRGPDLLVAIFSEEETTAVRILREHGVDRPDVLRGIGRAG